MIKSGPASSLAIVGKFQSLVRAKWIFALVAAGLVTVAATSPDQQIPDEQYIQIMSIVDRADALRKAGRTDEAHTKYVEAEKALFAFKNANPTFFPKTVAYRLKEVTERADTRPPVPPMTNSAAKPSANLEASKPAAAGKSTLKLIDAGAEPRTALRYHVKAGDKQAAVMTMKVKLDMPPAMANQGGGAVPSIPAISIPMDVTVQSVAANGDITYQTVMGEASIAPNANATPEIAQGMQGALAGIKGTTGTTVMSNRGVTRKSDIKTPANSNPQARQFLDQIKETTTQLSVELPEEAVGAGAKWETTEQTKGQAGPVDQTGTYELTAIEGDKVTTKFSANLDAMAGGKAAASGVSGSLSGTVNLDLSKAVAPSVEMNVHTEVPMGKDKSMVMKMDINMAVDAH